MRPAEPSDHSWTLDSPHGVDMPPTPEDKHLAAVAQWAARIHRELRPLLARRLGEVHFRPSSRGIAMIGLLPDRPQRGLTHITNLPNLITSFDALFQQHCVHARHGRPTPEKKLQSHLIADAIRHDGMMQTLNVQLSATPTPSRLELVTDEIAVPTANGKVVCDLLALHHIDDASLPAVIELKSSRDKTRLITQVETYAAFVDAHAAAYEALYSALLGRPITFAGPTERWILWPAAGPGPDRHEAELAERGIRIITYTTHPRGYDLRVGRDIARAHR